MNPCQTKFVVKYKLDHKQADGNNQSEFTFPSLSLALADVRRFSISGKIWVQILNESNGAAVSRLDCFPKPSYRGLESWLIASITTKFEE